MAAIDSNILYQDYVDTCKSLNIIPLCMIKWYDRFYSNQDKRQHKKYINVKEVIEEINKIRMNGIY